MELTRNQVALSGAPSGTKASLYVHEVVSETQEEAESLADLRATLADRGVTNGGNVYTGYQLMAVMAPPFYGRIVFPVKRKDGRERFLAMTDQAADLLLNRNFGPSKSPGFGDDICTGTADGKPCVHIANPDHKRIITVISSEAVIEQLTDFLLQFFEGVTKAMVNTAGPAVSDFVATNQAENLLLEVQTLRQFFKCLKRYGKYLDDTDTDDSCRESE